MQSGSVQIAIQLRLCSLNSLSKKHPNASSIELWLVFKFQHGTGMKSFNPNPNRSRSYQEFRPFPSPRTKAALSKKKQQLRGRPHASSFPQGKRINPLRFSRKHDAPRSSDQRIKQNKPFKEKARKPCLQQDSHQTHSNNNPFT